MRRVTLEQLRCIETEDWTGADEDRLEVFVDGVLQPYMKNSLNNGQKWDIGSSFNFNNQVEVKLWDEDSPDPDDFLGSSSIDTSLVDHAIASFTKEGANYQLVYSVADVPIPVDPVTQAITRFETSPEPGVWPNIRKVDLLADIRKRTEDPYLVNQDGTPLCGPAAIVFELVSRQPSRYVEICQELYETGQFRSRTKEVKPSDTLLHSISHPGLAVADWMVMATLRDTENALFPVEASSGQFVMGISTPWEMKGWTFEILGFDKVEYESTYTYGEFDAMRKAEGVRNRGGVALLMINSAMLGGSAPTIAIPEHWVSFLGDLSIDNGVWYRWDSGHIHFKCYSWGSSKIVDLGEGPFEDYMWGGVTGES